MLKGNEVNLGDPRPIRDLLYVEDLAKMYLTVIESNNKEILGQSINVSTGKGVSVDELVKKIASRTDFNGTINWRTRPPRPGEVWKIIAANSKARRLLGWEPRVMLDEGLDLVTDFWKKKLAPERRAQNP